MKVLFIGLGSIGQRHLRNLRGLFGDELEIMAFRVRGLKRTFSDSMQILENCSVDEMYNVKCFADLDEAFAQKPDVAYVTNITSLHVSTALKALRAGCHVFLEKPVSQSLDGVAELYEVAQSVGKEVFVGFQNRFHPCLQRLKALVDSQELGRIISVHSEMGERLTTMHSYEDYKGTYMARKDQGGGVIANQQIHELDYIQWIFGVPESVMAYSGKNSSLPIDVEDYCDALFWIDGKHGAFPVHAHADFFQHPSSRYCKVVFENGWAVADLIGNKFSYAKGEEIFNESFEEFQRNQLYISEAQEFFRVVKGETENMLPLTDGITSLRMSEAMRRSAAEKRPITLCEVQI